MEYQIIEVIKTVDRSFTVARGKKEFTDFPAKFDELTITVSKKSIKTEIVHIENNTIVVGRITV